VGFGQGFEEAGSWIRIRGFDYSSADVAEYSGFINSCVTRMISPGNMYCSDEINI
jgi:hypothetical protein